MGRMSLTEGGLVVAVLWVMAVCDEWIGWVACLHWEARSVSDMAYSKAGCCDMERAGTVQVYNSAWAKSCVGQSIRDPMMGLMSRCYRLFGSGCGCLQVVVPGSRGRGNMRGGLSGAWIQSSMGLYLHTDGLGVFGFMYSVVCM